MVDDIVLFLKNDSLLSSNYQYGIVDSVSPGRDMRIRKVTVSYKNSNENTFRSTIRAVRELIVIHGVDEKDISTELNEMYEKTK